jgi:hypothetical protein
MGGDNTCRCYFFETLRTFLVDHSATLNRQVAFYVDKHLQYLLLIKSMSALDFISFEL